MRFIDIANDLAFLGMDFDFEGRRDLGNLLLRNAALEFRDAGMLKIANFYKCYRAFVRGKVESIQTIERETVKPKEHQQHAARYFRLALQYAVAGSEAFVLVVMGRVGTGKTTVARQLGRELDWPIFSSDEVRKGLAGVPLTERTPPERRPEVYSQKMTEQTYARLIEDRLAAISRDRRSQSLAGHSCVILEAAFSSRVNRDFLREQCAKANVRVQVVELDAGLEEIKDRLRARDDTRLGRAEISDARLEDFEKLNAVYETPLELEPDLIKLSTTNGVSDAVKAILLQLAEKQAGAV